MISHNLQHIQSFLHLHIIFYLQINISYKMHLLLLKQNHLDILHNHFAQNQVLFLHHKWYIDHFCDCTCYHYKVRIYHLPIDIQRNIHSDRHMEYLQAPNHLDINQCKLSSPVYNIHLYIYTYYFDKSCLKDMCSICFLTHQSILFHKQLNMLIHYYIFSYRCLLLIQKNRFCMMFILTRPNINHRCKACMKFFQFLKLISCSMYRFHILYMFNQDHQYHIQACICS